MDTPFGEGIVNSASVRKAWRSHANVDITTQGPLHQAEKVISVVKRLTFQSYLTD